MSSKRARTSERVRIWLFALSVLVSIDGINTEIVMTRLSPIGGVGVGEFGEAVSIYNNTALISSWWDGEKGTYSGSAYIFKRNNNNNEWSQIIKLMANDGSTGDYFGTSVSIHDGRAIIGAPKDADLGTYAGAAYIYEEQSDGSWTQRAKLLASDGTDWDEFGRDVAIYGDYALVGTYRAESVYVFERSHRGKWSESAILTASDGANSDFFGSAVAMYDSFAAIGAYGDDDRGSGSGSVYIFKRVKGIWSEVEKITAGLYDGAAGDRFGFDVAIYNGLLVIGAPRRDHDDYVTDSGAAYVYQQGYGAWNQVAKLTGNEGGDKDDYFGESVAICDGIVVIGSAQDDDLGTNSGATYIFQIDEENGQWTQSGKIVANDGESDDEFGGSVSIYGDYVVMGASDKNKNMGSAYIMRNYLSCDMVMDEALNGDGDGIYSLWYTNHMYLINYTLTNCDFTPAIPPCDCYQIRLLSETSDSDSGTNCYRYKVNFCNDDIDTITLGQANADSICGADIESLIVSLSPPKLEYSVDLQGGPKLEGIDIRGLTDGESFRICFQEPMVMGTMETGFVTFDYGFGKSSCRVDGILPNLCASSQSAAIMDPLNLLDNPKDEEHRIMTGLITFGRIVILSVIVILTAILLIIAYITVIRSESMDRKLYDDMMNDKKVMMMMKL